MKSSFIDLRIPYLVTSGPLYQFCQILYLIILKNQNQKLKPQKNEFICHSRCHQSFFLPFFHFSSSYFFLQDVHILMLEFTISIRYIFKHISEAIIHSIVGSGTRSGGWDLNLDHYLPIFFLKTFKLVESTRAGLYLSCRCGLRLSVSQCNKQGVQFLTKY